MNEELIKLYLTGLEQLYFIDKLGARYMAKFDSPTEWYKKMYQLEAELYKWDSFNRDNSEEMNEAVKRRMHDIRQLMRKG